MIAFFSSLFPLSGETITLATLNWEPFFSENLEENGVFAALSREAFRRAGYELEIKFVPWNRALEEAKLGYYDGLLGAYLNDERERYFFYSDSIMKSEEVFVERAGSDIRFAHLADLMGYSIGSIRGFSYTPELIEQGFRIEQVSDDIINIRKLNAGRIDLIIIEKHHFALLLNRTEEFSTLGNAFRILTPSFRVLDLYCTVSRQKRGGEKIISDFNAALRDMREDGTYDEILSRFHVNPSAEITDNH